MSDLYISWPEYYDKIERLAVSVHQSGWAFNQLVCIAKGGLRIGDTFARLFDLPLAVMATSSYRGVGSQSTREQIVFSQHLAMTTQTLGSRVLLVDDLVDSGVTLERSVAWLKHHYTHIEEIRTAVLWYKSCSTAKPDYYVDYLSDDPWIHQPFERYESMSPADLVRSLEAV
ncbi:MAG: phosphoribosyltransferase [Elainellaceae cyanobacterium]